MDGPSLPLLATGARAPPFDLPNVDSRRIALMDFAGSKALVVAFWCNHCPEARRCERPFVAWAQEARKHGVGVVAINSDDETEHPEDGAPEMVVRARDQAYPFPYLRDATRATAARYGATCIPSFFVFDESFHLQYQGRFGGDEREGPGEHGPLAEAVAAILAGKPVKVDLTTATGCALGRGR